MSRQTSDIAHADWRVSSYSSSGGGNCVEAGPVVDRRGEIAVRHSHHPIGPMITYTRNAWAAFVGGIKAHTLGQPT